MAKKKSNFYAVKVGAKPGIYSSWDDCRAQVEGYGGCQYKGFSTKKEAEDYMAGKQSIFEPILQDTSLYESDMDIYVDGSFDHITGVYGYGYVVVFPDGTEEKYFGAGNNPNSARLRNVAGELIATMCAIKYALSQGAKSVKIYYDYMGIESWATGVWKAKNELTTRYASTIKKWNNDIKISFKKVTAHTNVKYNEIADSLAKYGVENFSNTFFGND